MAELTTDDISMLLEALTAWEDKDFSGMMIGTLIGGMLTDDKEKAKRDREVELVKYNEAKKVRQERSILLKAKLIGMKDSTIAAHALDEAPA